MTQILPMDIELVTRCEKHQPSNTCHRIFFKLEYHTKQDQIQ